MSKVTKPESKPGGVPARKKVKKALRSAKANLLAGIEMAQGAMAARLLGAGDNQETLFCFYDLKKQPISFDFPWYLCLADVERRRRQLSGLHVVFVSAGDWQDGTEKNEAYRAVVDGESRRWRFENILLPICGLVPSVTGYSFCGRRALAVSLGRLARTNRFPADYTANAPGYVVRNRPLIEAAREGIPVQALRANEQGLRYVRQWIDTHADGKRVVTITLRQYDFEVARNSDVAAWGQFASKLRDDGFFPVIIPDTDKAMLGLPAELDGLPFFPEVAWNLGLRAALYELAWVNLGSTGGPTWGLWLLNANTRFLIFKAIVESERLSSEQHHRKISHPVDEQFPFSGRFQRVLWRTPDDFPSISREFHKMAAEIEAVEDSSDAMEDPAVSVRSA